MQKELLLLLFLTLSVLLGSYVGERQTAAFQQAQSAEPEPPLLYAAPRTDGMPYLRDEILMQYGPSICSGYGDPYSPLDPNWTGNNDQYDGLYSYRYLIHVPSSYAANHDEIRVEIFDPDSINTAVNDVTIFHTQAWIDDGRSPTETLSCPSSNQQNGCTIDTEENQLNAPSEQINPQWFVRVDGNRGAGSAPGNGACGRPGSYDEAFNTQTDFTLYYLAETGPNSQQRINLARYVGQTGQETTDHQTDLRWVSPGAPVSYDQPAFVPADPNYGTVRSFQIDIATDLPGVVRDAVTGDFYLYLDITTLQGASRNGFGLWAGPPDYINTIAGDSNLRNVQLANSPGAADSAGVTILAEGTIPLITLPSESGFGRPLLFVPASQAGETLLVYAFDTDSGSAGPLVFYFDTLAFTPDSSPNGYDEANTDWAIAFSIDGEPDEDGRSRTCAIGSCNNVWAEPAYQIEIPEPFSGGNLMMRYQSGDGDQNAWRFVWLPSDDPTPRPTPTVTPTTTASPTPTSTPTQTPTPGPTPTATATPPQNPLYLPLVEN